MEKYKLTQTARKNKPRFVNKRGGKRLKSPHKEDGEDYQMIKGISHRVIVVKSPDERYFEEAIFVIREDAIQNHGANKERILTEARKIANAYVKGASCVQIKSKKKISSVLVLCLSVALAGACLIALRVFL